MRAVCWYGKKDVRVEEVSEPNIMNPRDAIVAVTSTAISHADLEAYGGRNGAMRKGQVLGHEFMGEVVEVGPGVSRIKPGQRVVVPFVVSCGRCWYCKRQEWSHCDNTNPDPWMGEKVLGGSPPGVFGSSSLFGGYAGGHADYVRVPFADIGCLEIDGDLPDQKVLFLSKTLPEAYMAVEQVEIEPGDAVVVWGCGPAGQLAIKCARLFDPGFIIAIDGAAARLLMAKNHAGADYVIQESSETLGQLRELTGGRGADVVIDASSSMNGSSVRRDQSNLPVLACRKGGTLTLAMERVGDLDGAVLHVAMANGVSIKTGPPHVHRYMRPLLDHIAQGDIDPSFIVTHRLVLADAPVGYDLLDRKEGCVKVVLEP